MMVMYAFGLSTIMGFNFESPWFMTLELLALVQILWTEIALVLAYFLFEKRDI
jgi:ABC-type transport system involved in multi-copper enzyme maturation permease subunit